MRFKALPVTSLEDATVDFEQLQASGVDRINGTTLPLTGSAWTAPALLNSWTNVAASAPAGYLKDPLGFVHLRGRITGGANGAQALLLPAGFRPNSGVGNRTYPAAGALAGSINGGAGLAINSSGVVLAFFATSVTDVGFDIVFLAEN